MGGTFDPIHVGHLRAAELAREVLGLDEVAFIPSHVPPHRAPTISAARDRYAMVCLATDGHPRFVPSDVELAREGPSYTVETLDALRAARPEDELVLIVGSDTFPEMKTWRDPEGIFARATIAVVTRPGGAPAAPLPEQPKVRCVDGAGLLVSSTAIRLLVAAGRSVRYLVPEPVADYIAKRGLYR
jgi:nicotinate-nucleotide adenylyltransferase